MLDGRKGAPRDIVLFNAGAALLVAGRVSSIREGIAQAVVAIDSGARERHTRPDGAIVSRGGRGMTATPDLLAAIVAATETITEVRRQKESLAALERRAAERTPRGDEFLAALSKPGRSNVIAECKRRSPSRGVLAAQYEPVAIARQYEAGGAAAISVLTEPTFFDGALEHLAAVRQAVTLPLLRKDFIVDEYQLLEARANGADAALLIVAALEQADLVRLQQRAWELGLAALVEVHDDGELSRAIDSGARIIGVNNRNLRTLAVDVAASRRLGARIPADVVGVSESGLTSRADLEELAGQGYRAFLIGERFMTAPDPANAIAELLGGRESFDQDSAARTGSVLNK